MAEHQIRLGGIGQIARAASIVLLVYWAGFALLSPVTVWDSHVYNLGRLPLAEMGGLFDNGLWTSERQLMFPWGFDAVHLPLLHAGWAFGLPSFLCLIGTLAVVGSFLTQSYDREAGWVGILCLLGLPALVFQSVVTKNDVAVLFGVAVWFHALRLWQRDRAARHLLFAGLALGFTVGAKTSGLLPAIICALVTLWFVRKSRHEVLVFLGATAAAVTLLGSVETYVASYRQYGTPFGRAQFVQYHRNNDGVRGTAANALRYAFGSTSTGIEIWQSPDRITPRLEKLCSGLLARLSLLNRGNRPDNDDRKLSFEKQHGDANSDFGPIGCACLGMFALVCLRWRPREAWWRLGAFAVLIAGGICSSVAWMPWNNRFLMLPFVLLTVALVSLLYAHHSSRRWPILLLLGVALYSAVAFPLTSYNKRPSDLVAAVTRRDQQMFRERPTLYPVYAAARAWAGSHPQSQLQLIAGSDSWILPFFYSPALHVAILPMAQVDAMLTEAVATGKTGAVLVLNREDFPMIQVPVRELQRFPDEPGTFLFEALPKGAIPLPAISQDSGFFSDGWTGDTFVMSVKYWPDRQFNLGLANPAPLQRQVSIQSPAGLISVILAANERTTIPLPLEGNTRFRVTVTPAFIPREYSVASDVRRLGLLVTFPTPSPTTPPTPRP